VSDALAADEQIVVKIIELDAANEELTGIVVGHTPFILDGERDTLRTGETNLSNLITDSMRWATGADIAFINSGGIRAGIPAGDITMGHVLTVLPFSNQLVTLELNGKSLLMILEYGVSLYPEPEGRHIQVSGIHFEIDPDEEPGNKVKKVTMADGSAFNANKAYTVATVEFLTLSGDEYETILKNGRNLVYYGSDAEVLVEYLATNPVIQAEAEGRFGIFSEDATVLEQLEEAENKDNPQTGDNSNIITWLWIGGVGLLGISGIALVTARSKRRNTGGDFN
jgi:5'-nucleotidase